MAGLPQPNDQFTGSSDPILIGVEVRCEDSFDDFGAASSEIVKAIPPYSYKPSRIMLSRCEKSLTGNANVLSDLFNAMHWVREFSSAFFL